MFLTHGSIFSFNINNKSLLIYNVKSKNEAREWLHAYHSHSLIRKKRLWKVMRRKVHKSTWDEAKKVSRWWKLETEPYDAEVSHMIPWERSSYPLELWNSHWTVLQEGDEYLFFDSTVDAPVHWTRCHIINILVICLESFLSYQREVSMRLFGSTSKPHGRGKGIWVF